MNTIETEKFNKCHQAVIHVAKLIHNSEKHRHLLGYGTEAFELIADAIELTEGISRVQARDFLQGK